MPKISGGEQNLCFCITCSCKYINSFYYCTSAQNKLKLSCCINSEDCFRAEILKYATLQIPSLFNLTLSCVRNLTLRSFSGNMMMFFLTLCQIYHSSYFNIVLRSCGTNSHVSVQHRTGIPNII